MNAHTKRTIGIASGTAFVGLVAGAVLISQSQSTSKPSAEDTATGSGAHGARDARQASGGIQRLDCGDARSSFVGTDVEGHVNVGDGAVRGRCELTFARPWPAAPVCQIEATGPATIAEVSEAHLVLIVEADTHVHFLCKEKRQP